MKRFSHYFRYVALGLVTALAMSCGKQPSLPKIDGVKGPFFNVQDGRVLISVTFEKLQVMGGGRFPIPKLDNSYFEMTPAQTGGTFFQAVLDLEDIQNENWELVDPHTLPGGRPLPGVVGGQLPMLAVNVEPLLDSTFYVSKSVFGFFIPFRVAADVILTYPIYMDGKHIGNISLVGQDENQQNSGLLALFNLNFQGKEKLQKLINESKKPKNRGKLY